MKKRSTFFIKSFASEPYNGIIKFFDLFEWKSIEEIKILYIFIDYIYHYFKIIV